MKRLSICATPSFLIALALLLLNDFYLKANHPSWLTGKLSDFAGSIVLPLLVFALAKTQTRLLAWLFVFLFAWWKSPLSQPLIDLINATHLIRIGRVIDYTDLLALVVLPYAVRLYSRHTSGDVSNSIWRRAVAIPSCALAILGIMATSAIAYTRHFMIQSTGSDIVLSHTEVQGVLDSIASGEGAECRVPDRPRDATERVCKINSVWLRYQIGDGGVQFRLESDPYSFGGRRHARRVNRLVDELQRAFGAQFSDLEYVEPLGERLR